MNFPYYILLIIFFIGALICQYFIDNQQKNYIEPIFDSADDINLCPKTAKFLSEIQSGFKTHRFAIYAACVTGIIMIGLLICYNLINNDTIPSTAIFYIGFTCIVVYFSVYKVTICILSRLCNFHSCALKYIEKTSV